MPAVDHAFSTALFHHKGGNLPQAEAYCRRVLKKDSEHSESLHLLGVIASESGDQQAAAVLIGRAIKAGGPRPEYCVNLGLVLCRQGNLADGAICYRQALQTNPNDWQTLLKLGRALRGLGHRKAAKEAIEVAVAISSEADAHFELANQLHLEGDLPSAAEHFRTALRLRPAFAEAHFNLGVTLTMQNKVDEAMSAYANALLLKPNYPEAWNNCGILLQAQGRPTEAVEHYRQAIQHDPEYLDPYYNLAVAYQLHDQLTEALNAYDRLIELNAQHPEAHNNRGNVLLALGNPLGATDAYAQAIAIDPNHSEACWNLGLAHLLLGRFAEGWPNYEWRIRQADSKPREFRAPQWTGAHVPEARILIYSEQGLGDTLQFARYAPMVKERCGYLIFECQPSVVRTLYSVKGIDQVIANGTELPHFDYHVPLLSLPYIFGTVEESIPSSIPYIAPPASLIRQWSNRVPASNDLNVGLVWAGNPAHKNDRHRSIAASELTALLEISGVRFYSLQKDSKLDGAIALGCDLTDFAETAAAVANLDLVISVDTSTAHLAGAMGKPVWLLLAAMPDWRWMLGRSDSPWYPSMQLFRQTEAGNWKSVIEAIKARLLNLRDTRKELALVG